METIITVLILVAYAIYTISQNYKQQDENRPTMEEPFEREQEQGREGEQADEWGRGDQFPEKQPRETPQPTEPLPEDQPYTPEPFSQSKDYQETESAPPERERAPYQRPAQNPYHESGHKNTYQRTNRKAYKNSYQRQHSRKRLKKRPLQKRLQSFDPVQAVIFSEVLNKPKFQELDEGHWY